MRFLNFLKKGETDQKFSETDQNMGKQMSFKVFENRGNGSKKWGNAPKILGNPSKIFE